MLSGSVNEMQIPRVDLKHSKKFVKCSQISQYYYKNMQRSEEILSWFINMILWIWKAFHKVKIPSLLREMM